MRHLYEYGLPADKKDTECIQGIMDKSKGDIAKATKLAQNMAKAIKDDSKIRGRYQAAVDLLGAEHPVAQAFNPSGADTTVAPGKPAAPKSALEQVLDQNPQILSDIKAAFKFKGLNFDSFNKSKLMVLTPAEAFKYGGIEGDKYFKIWVADGRIGFVTWANTMIDTKFKWNSKGKGADKRDQAAIIGTKADIDGFYKSNNYIKKMETVFMLPFDAFGKAAIEMVEDEKAKALAGLEYLKLHSNSVFDLNLYQETFTLMKRTADAWTKEMYDKVKKVVEYFDCSMDNNPSIHTDNWKTDSGYGGLGGYHQWKISGSIVFKVPGSYYKRYINSWFCSLDKKNPELTTYNWDGSTRSDGGNYDKKEATTAGVGKAASMIKFTIKKICAAIKKIPGYSDYMQLLQDCAEAEKHTNDSGIKNKFISNVVEPKLQACGENPSSIGFSLYDRDICLSFKEVQALIRSSNRYPTRKIEAALKPHLEKIKKEFPKAYISKSYIYLPL